MGVFNVDENHLKQEFNRIDTNHGGYILFDEVCYLDFKIKFSYFCFK
jgi:hypothetical protein